MKLVKLNIIVNIGTNQPVNSRYKSIAIEGEFVFEGKVLKSYRHGARS